MAYLAEAADLARELGDSWRLSQILSWQQLRRAALTRDEPVTDGFGGQDGPAEPR
jgi:hypothetical protein